MVYRNESSYFVNQNESRMRSAGSTGTAAAWVSAPAATQGRRTAVRQADQYLREFWQRLTAVAPVIEQSGDARKRGCGYERSRAKSTGEGGLGVRERRMKEEVVADPAKKWQGREGERQATRQVLRLPPPSARWKDETAERSNVRHKSRFAFCFL